MALQDDLLEIERGFWTGGADFYRRHADEHCLTAFPQMAAVLSNEDLAGSVGDGPRWNEPDVEVKGLVLPPPTSPYSPTKRPPPAPTIPPTTPWSAAPTCAATTTGS